MCYKKWASREKGLRNAHIPFARKGDVHNLMYYPKHTLTLEWYMVRCDLRMDTKKTCVDKILDNEPKICVQFWMQLLKKLGGGTYSI